MYTFVVDVARKHTRSIQSLLDEHDTDYYMVGRKALGFPDTVVVVAGTLTIAWRIYSFIKELRKKGDADVDIIIRVYSIREFGPTPHEIATEEEIRQAISAASPNQVEDAE